MRANKCGNEHTEVGAMGGSSALEEATSRLLGALEEFEQTVAARLNESQSIDALKGQIALLRAERDRLHSGLEAERQRANRLESASEEVSERLGSVIDSVKAIMRTN